MHFNLPRHWSGAKEDRLDQASFLLIGGYARQVGEKDLAFSH